jgi:hypothetical protein
MLMIGYLLFVLGVLLVASPGVICWTLLFPNDPAERRIAWGTVLGTATAVYVAEVCSYFHLSWFYGAWTAVMAASIGSFLWWRPQRQLDSRSRNDNADGAGLAARSSSILVLLLLTIGVLQILVVSRQSIPLGWDPSFHLLLAKKIALSDHFIRDWLPFDNAALNYPIGSHFLIVLFAWFSGLPLTLVFQLLTVTFCLLGTLAIYALAEEYFASSTIGLYAAIAYGGWAFWGSADYLRWGGLPNQLGMLMGLAILSLLIRTGEQKKSIALIGLLFASICLTHHHVMVTMGIILIVQMLIFLAIRDPERRYQTIFFGLCLAAAAAAFYLVPYALKAASLSDTRVFHLQDQLDFTTMGLVLVPFALAGAALDYYRRRASVHVLHSVCATLLVLYVLLGPMFYLYQLFSTGEGFVAFTPSRFLSNLAYFFSIFAGYALYRFQKRYSLSAPLTIAVALLLALTNLPQWKVLMTPDADRGRFAAYNWIEGHAPPNSIVLTVDSWACYATWRRTLRTPMPISEPRVPPRISALARVEWLAGLMPAELRGVPLIEVFGPHQPHGGKLLWSNADGWGVTMHDDRVPEPNHHRAALPVD